MSKSGLRQWLLAQPACVTYAEAAAAMGLSPPGVIAQVTALLEATMVDDAAAGQPFVAARVVSRATALPGRGFFDLAARLGRFDGSDAAAFHAAECAALSRAPEGPKTGA
ncbi:MAG: hypothetical protein GC186_04500 [Rhodobacteraceae bacterium]|nr:hypothetical protein [Paracoccaceae bacterium]